MSWYVKAMGTPSKVIAALDGQFSKQTCVEPEETARQSARTAMLAVLGAMDDAVPVLAYARGSQSQAMGGGPIYGEVEMRVELLNTMLS